MFFTNREVNWLALHSGLRELAWGLAGVFVFAYLLQAGLSPVGAFLAVSATLALRFATRPLAFALIRSRGVRVTMVLGSVLYASQFPVLAAADASAPWTVAAYVMVAASAEVFYWTCYHAVFATVGDAGLRGAQVGVRGLILLSAGAVGPVTGGLLLATHGPWAFGAATLIALAAIAPLLQVRVPAVDLATDHGFRPFRAGVLLFVTDGFVMCGIGFTWGLIMFEAFDRRFDAFGWLLGAAALGGAVGGLLLGRLIDAGHARRIVWLNLFAMTAMVFLRVGLADSRTGVVIASVVANALAGLYSPTLMTAVYNAAKASPCAVRFHYLAEAGWDVGGLAACLTAAALLALGLPVTWVIVAALPVIAAQAVMLHRCYAPRTKPVALIAGPSSTGRTIDAPTIVAPGQPRVGNRVARETLEAAASGRTG